MGCPGAGRVVSVDQATVYVSLGSAAGIREGDTFAVYRLGQELRGPVTGEVLGEQKRKVATLKVFGVAQKFSKAKAEGELEVELVSGNVVEPPGGGGALVAVFPLTDEEGRVTKGGLSVAESITTELVGRGAGVMERTILLTVLAEQAVGQILDAKKAEGVGRQLVAAAVVVGTVVDGKSRSNVNVRLVDVATGKIFNAAAVAGPSLARKPRVDGLK